MGHEGLLVLATVIRTSAPIELDTTPLRVDDSPLPIDFSRAIDLDRELPAKQPEIDLELRDNSVEGDWSRTEDFELVGTSGPWSIAVNNHFIVRNIGEAQLVASFAIEY